ncbi:MAG: hypothetical protein Q8R78_03300, partial [Candidatus Omnitrophota bacterium]|nr:hypothetical protein [Candidatus Omnitrophota bacterium]
MRRLVSILVVLICCGPAWAEQLVLDRSSKAVNLAQLADEIEVALGRRLAMGLNATSFQVDDFEQLTAAQQQQVR